MPIETLVIVITVGSVVAMLVLGGAGIGVTYVLRPKILLRRRMAQIGVIDGPKAADGRSDGRRQRRIQDQIRQLERRKKKKGFIDSLRADLLQAGLDLSPNTFIVISLGVGVFGALIYLLTGANPLGAVAAFIVGMLLVPRFIIKSMAKRRQKQFTANFADAIDLIVRGIKSGLPVNECFNVVAREFNPPLGEEFRLMVEGQNLGMTLDDLMDKGIERLPTAEYKFFAIVLQIQRQTGGNLADTLGNLSSVLRQRKQLRDKVQAMASEAKASAMIIGSLPWFVTGVLSVVNPEYLLLLWTEPAGNVMLGVGACWLTLGITVMRKMINFKI